MPSYHWLLVWLPEVNEQLRALSKRERNLLFTKIAALASAEDPYSMPGVEILFEKRFNKARKIRQGNYRMFFTVHPGELEHQKFIYKGRLEILAIIDRKDSYKK